jgi:hypothetical protein
MQAHSLKNAVILFPGIRDTMYAATELGDGIAAVRHTVHSKGNSRSRT